MSVINKPIKSTIKSQKAELTIADGLLFLVFCAGGLLRFFNLAALPLNETEAELAWAVWRFWQPGAPALTISSPAYFTLTALLTQLLGFSDFVMRLVPAAFGTAVIALPWLLRHRLGRLGMLVMSLLLAVSPLQVILSRTVEGGAIAVFALGLQAVALVRQRETPNGLWLAVAAVALGLGLASAPLFYTGLSALGIAFVLQRRIGTPLFSNEIEKNTYRPDRQTVIAFAITFVGMSTLFLWYPNGLGRSVGLLGEWVTAFTGNNGRAVLDPLLAVARYEPLLVLLGVPVLIWAILRNRPQALLGMYWLTALLLLLVLQQGVMNNAVLFVLPGGLLLAEYAQSQWERINRLTMAISGIVFLGIGLLAVNFSRYSRILQYNADNLLVITIIFLVITVGGLSLYFLATWEPAMTMRALFLGVLVAGLYFTWGTAWWLAQEAANNPRERWVAGGTDASVRIMQELMADISRQTRNSTTELEVMSAVDTAVIRWYLRSFTSLEIGETVPALGTYDVVITPFTQDSPLAAGYVGTDFKIRLAGSRAAETPSLTPVFDTLRWWLFHESQQAINYDTIVVWVRGDLIQGP